MFYNYVFTCDTCGHEMEVPANFGDQYDAGKCRHCNDGRMIKTGESYDQEFIDEQKYNEQQDREYEERHRHDDRY